MRTNQASLTAAMHDHRPRCRLCQNGGLPVHYSAVKAPQSIIGSLAPPNRGQNYDAFLAFADVSAQIQAGVKPAV